MKMIRSLIVVVGLLTVIAAAVPDHLKSQSIRHKQEAIVGVKVDDDTVRVAQVAGWPNISSPHAISVAAVRIQKDQQTTQLDAVSFKMVDPIWRGLDGNDAPQQTFYFGYFNAQSQVDQSGTTHSSAGLFQMIARFFEVFIYKNNNGQPGFQYILTDSKLSCDCSSTSTACAHWGTNADCFLDHYNLSAVNWEYITHENSTFMFEGEEYVVHKFTAASVDGVYTVRFKIAARAAEMDGVVITPDQMKIDVEIHYFNNLNFQPPPAVENEPNAHVGILVGAMGNMNGREATMVTNPDGSISMQFEYTNGKDHFVGAFEWEGKATVDLQQSEVYDSFVTDKQILDSNNLILKLSGLPIAVSIYNAWKWYGAFHFFSWNAAKPSVVTWDPTLGMAPLSPAWTNVPDFLLVLLLVLVVLIRRP